VPFLRFKTNDHLDAVPHIPDVWARPARMASHRQDPRPAVLPNTSAGNGARPQVLEAQQHGQHPFELAVKVDLVAAEPLQLVGIERLMAGPDQR
jgi:hypothetical protein